MVPQPCAGAEQAFLGRLSKLWSATYGKEAGGASAAKHRLSGGRAWARKACSAAWGHARPMWLGRSQGRHGREPKERKERARQRSLREAAVWHSRKGKRLLGTAEAEKLFFYPSFARHKERESHRLQQWARG